jgi:hypothetical protein
LSAERDECGTRHLDAPNAERDTDDREAQEGSDD